MNARRIGTMVLVALLAPLVQASDIYKWVDEQGRVSYGDREAVPDRYKRTARKIDINEDYLVTPGPGQKRQIEPRGESSSATGSGRPAAGGQKP